MKNADDYNKDEIGIKDPYLNMEFVTRHDNEEGLHHPRIKRRDVNNEGRPMGTPNNNPFLDQRKYEVELLDRRIDILTANIIDKNLLEQVDDDGHRHLLMDEIENHRREESDITKSQGTLTTESGMQRKKQAMVGWEFYVRWKGGSGDWIAMKDLKDSYPVPLADYAMANDIQDDPDFAWWVPFTLRKRISNIKKI